MTIKQICKRKDLLDITGLKPKDFTRENMCVIARKQNVTPRAVRGSIFAIRHALSHTSEDNFLILKKIYLKEVKK